MRILGDKPTNLGPKSCPASPEESMKLLLMEIFLFLLSFHSHPFAGRCCLMGCHVLLLILGGARASYLYIDAYNTKGEFPVWLDHALTAVGMPTLASALHLVFVALIVTSKVS